MPPFQTLAPFRVPGEAHAAARLDALTREQNVEKQETRQIEKMTVQGVFRTWVIL